MTTTETIPALALADALRHGRAIAKPFDLWLAADRESGGIVSGRILRYRHALVHAGYALNRRGNPYKVCPMCHERLRR